MYCRICGDERNAEYRSAQRQTLCPSCLADTPAKVSRAQFDLTYWPKEELEQLSESTKKEFYSDYLASTYTLKEYVLATVETE